MPSSIGLDHRGYLAAVITDTNRDGYSSSTYPPRNRHGCSRWPWRERTTSLDMSTRKRDESERRRNAIWSRIENRVLGRGYVDHCLSPIVRRAQSWHSETNSMSFASLRSLCRDTATKKPPTHHSSLDRASRDAEVARARNARVARYASLRCLAASICSHVAQASWSGRPASTSVCLLQSPPAATAWRRSGRLRRD